LYDYLGYLAGVCTTVAFFPQIWRIWKTRSTKDISLGMYIVFISGILLWLIYGALIGSLPLMIANSLTLILSVFILLMKLRHG
jgi:MtN3 and saliva related transmembrane protein